MTRPEVLVIGRDGQLARSLAERARAHQVSIAFAGRPEIDLLALETIAAAVCGTPAGTIINAAAYTAVDRAETDPSVAMQVNANAVEAIAEAAAMSGKRLIHISTDYVFDGNKLGAYVETDRTSPLGVYGRTKLAGEEAVRAQLGRHAIVRTSWVYSPFGRNFVKTMFGLCDQAEVRVVADQSGTPTSALDLADGLLAMVERWQTDPEHGLGETYHLAGTGIASWAEFADAIFELAAHGGQRPQVVPITTADYPTLAKRPTNSALSSAKFASGFGYVAPVWRASLAECIAILQSGGS